MSRTPFPPVALLVDPSEATAAHAEVLSGEQMAGTIARAVSDERDLLNQMFGQVQMAQAFRKFADVVSLSKLSHIKETKMYRALSGKSGVDVHGDEIADVGTWDGFCRAIGSSKSKVDEDLLNLKAFGEDAMESLSRIGAGVREMRQYRRLPADERSALIEAAKAGDKDDLLDLAETLIARHIKEKETLESRATEAEETADARSEVIAKKESRINALEEDLHKSRRRLESQTPDEVGEQLRQETAGVGWSIVGRLNVDLAKAFAALDAHARAADCSHDEFMSGVLFDIQRAVHAIREDYAVKERPDGDARPDWTRPDYNPQLDADTEASRQNFIKEHGYDPMPQFPAPHPAGNA